jgi:proline dehydrogenase
VIGRLAGQARHVAVATHDLTLAQKAADVLRSADTPFELEMILGMPIAPLLQWAKKSSVPVRIYVPFGPGYVPNALGILRRNPRLAWRVARGMLSGAAAP